MRDRQRLFASIDNFDHKAFAAADLGFVWAANTNVVPSSMWMTLQAFRDPALLARIRAELTANVDAAAISELELDSANLDNLNLMQSVYAKVLRLYVQAYSVRYTGEKQLQVNDWIVPRRSIILASTTEAAMDPTFWNTKAGAHLVHTFWAERFLVHPDNPTSGPMAKPPMTARTGSPKPFGTQPKFSLAGTTGWWFPYGGGPRQCIGRAFSKRAMIGACAAMVSFFDIEILASEKDLGLDPKFYGLGGQGLVGKVRFRIRRRRLE